MKMPPVEKTDANCLFWILHQNAQTQMLTNSPQCMQSRNIERCHVLSCSFPQSIRTTKPLRLESVDMIESATCGKFVSILFKCSWLIVYTSLIISVLSSRTKSDPPERFRSKVLVRNLKRILLAGGEVIGMLMLSYVQAPAAIYLYIEFI